MTTPTKGAMRAMLEIADRFNLNPLSDGMIHGAEIIDAHTHAAELEARLRANIAAFEAINEITPWRATEPQWWVAWSQQCREDRALLAKLEGAK